MLGIPGLGDPPKCALLNLKASARGHGRQRVALESLGCLAAGIPPHTHKGAGDAVKVTLAGARLARISAKTRRLITAEDTEETSSIGSRR